jgi:two-component system, OmpR family, phosphate regulon sensor histidine kinase PhoR
VNGLELLLAALCGVLAAAVVYLIFKLARLTAEESREEPGPVEEPRDVSKQGEHPVEEILERMGEGVLLLDAELAPILANASARNMLGLGNETFTLRLTSEEVNSVARLAMESSEETEDIVSLWYPRRGQLRVRATPLTDHGGVVVVIRDITEELRTQRIRREFVAHASHELKSPVAGLQTLAEAVREAVVDDPATAQRFSEKLVAEADRLGRLIGDLLDLSRLEEPTEVSKEKVDISFLVRAEIETVRKEAESKGIELGQNVDRDIWVEGDEQQLSLMLRNLLDNALRYTPSLGHVAIDVRREGDEAVVRVIDTGIGIPREAQARVFERFYRVDRARSRDRGGTGLGLAIVKHAVELHGGRIGLESELERGSTFIVRLPAREPGRPQISSVAG